MPDRVAALMERWRGLWGAHHAPDCTFSSGIYRGHVSIPLDGSPLLQGTKQTSPGFPIAIIPPR
jgi:hypothetical protein